MKYNWDKYAINFLKDNYIEQGGKFCSEKLSIPIFSIREKASKLKLRRMAKNWTKEEVEFLKKNYSKYGSKYCALKLNCKRSRVRIKASYLGIKNTQNKNKKSKMCSSCFKEKLLNEYSPHPTGRFGLYPTCKKCNSENETKKRKSNIKYKIIHNLRSRVSIAIKKNIKRGHTLDLIGCKIDFLKEYLSKKFTKGMSWDNYGEWHIDHIRPCASFDLSEPDQQKICFHYSNLQPLWKRDNLSKGSKCN